MVTLAHAATLATQAHTQPTKAEALLTTMLDTGLAATEISFTSVIVAYAKAGRPKEAGKWLQRMLDSNVNPDTIACNAVLLAHANAGVKPKQGCRLQPHSHLRWRGVGEQRGACPRLQPYVSLAATRCVLGCNPM